MSATSMRALKFTATEPVVTLMDGRKIVTRRLVIRGSSALRQKSARISTGTHWPDLDEGLGIAEMLKGRRV